MAETVCLNTKEIVPQAPEKVMCLFKLLPCNITYIESQNQKTLQNLLNTPIYNIYIHIHTHIYIYTSDNNTKLFYIGSVYKTYISVRYNIYNIHIYITYYIHACFGKLFNLKHTQLIGHYRFLDKSASLSFQRIVTKCGKWSFNLICKNIHLRN